MKAMALTRIASLDLRQHPLEPVDWPMPEPGDQEILLKVACCGVCHTELDEIEGRTPPPRLPVIPGHQVIGRIERWGKAVNDVRTGDRLGVAWIFSACGRCKFCRAGLENLCSGFMATGRDVNGGYAEYMTAPRRFCYKIPEGFSDEEAAPLLCAGAIGYRSLRLTGLRNGQRLGLTGFGASGHLVLKMARHLFPESAVFVFARSEQEREFARSLGAEWAGDTQEQSPYKLDAVIDTTPAWLPIVEALANLEPGGRLIINAVGKQDDKSALLRLEYSKHLWLEKEIKSVANITQRDVNDFLTLAAALKIRPEIRIYPLSEANAALAALKRGHARGAKVLKIG